jgi:hypothetical protein
MLLFTRYEVLRFFQNEALKIMARIIERKEEVEMDQIPP